MSVLEHVAVHIVLTVLREVQEPMALFARHAVADPELALVRGGPHATRLLAHAVARHLLIDSISAAAARVSCAC